MGAPPFVPLPSGNNPSVGAAAGAGQSASSAYLAGLQFASALRAFNANQQQQAYQNQQQGLKAQMDRHIQMTKDGYTPADTVTHGAPSTPSTPGTFSHRDAKPGVDPSRVVTDEFGRRWVSPPAKPDATPQQTYTDLQAALEKGGQPVSPEGNVHQMTTTPRVSVDMQGNQTDTGKMGVNVPVPDTSRVVTPPGSKQGIYMPTGDERAASTLQQQLTAEAAKTDAASMVLPDSLADSLTDHAGLPQGILRGVRIPKEAIAGTFGKLLTPEKPDATSFVPGMYGPNGGPILYNKNDQSTKEVPVPPGSKRELTPGQQEIVARFKEREADKAEARKTAAENRAQAGRDSAQKQLDVYQQQEQPLHALRSEWGSLMTDADQRSAEAGGKPITVVDPETKREVPWNEARRKYYNAKIEATGRKIQGLQDTQKKLIERHGGDTGEGAPAPTSQAQPAQPAQPKTATIQQVQAYARKNGITVDEAARRVKAEGYTVGK